MGTICDDDERKDDDNYDDGNGDDDGFALITSHTLGHEAVHLLSFGM